MGFAEPSWEHGQARRSFWSGSSAFVLARLTSVSRHPNSHGLLPDVSSLERQSPTAARVSGAHCPRNVGLQFAETGERRPSGDGGRRAKRNHHAISQKSSTRRKMVWSLPDDAARHEAARGTLIGRVLGEPGESESSRLTAERETTAESPVRGSTALYFASGRRCRENGRRSALWSAQRSRQVSQPTRAGREKRIGRARGRAMLNWR